MTRLLRLNGLLVLAAAIVVALWIRAVGGFEGIAGLPAPGPIQIAVMLGLTAACVLARFFRFQFLMRHAGSRLIERPSLLLYLASLVGTATPAYIGEAIRCAFLRRQFRSADTRHGRRRTIWPALRSRANSAAVFNRRYTLRGSLGFIQNDS